MKILIVDDEPELAELLKFGLEDLSYDVEVKSNPLDALESLKSNSFDLVLTDNHMPKMTGLELIQKMPTNIPVFLISGNPTLETDNLGDHFKGVIPKPFDCNQIHEKIKVFNKND